MNVKDVYSFPRQNYRISAEYDHENRLMDEKASRVSYSDLMFVLMQNSTVSLFGTYFDGLWVRQTCMNTDCTTL